MKTKLLFSLFIISLSVSSLHAEETQYENQIKREFTVTTIAIDAQNERLQSEQDIDENNTKMQGGDTE